MDTISLEMPAEMPGLHHENQVVACIIKASSAYGLDPVLLAAVRQQEGGKVGRYSRNSNGTFDMGPMQINTLWLKPLKKQFNIDENMLIFDACTNVFVGAWILRNEINQAGAVWKGVGNYHSRTPRYHNRYLEKIKKRYHTLISRLKQQKANKSAPRVAIIEAEFDGQRRRLNAE